MGTDKKDIDSPHDNRVCEEDVAYEVRPKLKPYTREEIDSWLDRAEAAMEAGEGITVEELRARMRKRFPELCPMDDIRRWLERSDASLAGRHLTLDEAMERLDELHAEMTRPYTAEELQERIRQAEAEDPTGTDWNDFVKELKQEFPWLRG